MTYSVNFSDMMERCIAELISEAQHQIMYKELSKMVEKSMSVKGKVKAHLIDLRLRDDLTPEYVTVKLNIDPKVFKKCNKTK